MRSRRRRGCSRTGWWRAKGARRLLYAERRGLSARTLKEFRIGVAPNAKDALKTALLKKGFTEAQLLEAGLVIKPDDGRPTYDRFRNRLTIPILDAKSRVIAFGARALDPGAEPKYLNSPETRLFDKGSTVFNFARARQSAFDSGELIVVEGYMDVIALHQAGFANAVATLGTAFTERQMELLWQLADEPIVCFDGDRAGEAAAARAIDRMLPNLREGHSFRFAFLPEGSDPDDLVRAKGAQGPGRMSRRRASADRRPVAARAEGAGHRHARAPRRLRGAARGLLAQIGNARGSSDHYRREVKNRLFALWRDRAPGAASAPPLRPDPAAGARRRRCPRLTASPPSSSSRSSIIPWLLDRFAEEVAASRSGTRRSRACSGRQPHHLRGARA